MNTLGRQRELSNTNRKYWNEYTIALPLRQSFPIIHLKHSSVRPFRSLFTFCPSVCNNKRNSLDPFSLQFHIGPVFYFFFYLHLCYGLWERLGHRKIYCETKLEFYSQKDSVQNDEFLFLLLLFMKKSLFEHDSENHRG